MPAHSRIGEILLKAKVIDGLQLRSAMSQHERWGGRLTKIVSDLGLADEDTIADAVAKAFGAQRMQLGHLTRDSAALAKVDVALAEEKGIFPVALKESGRVLVLAMADPSDLELIDQVAMKARARVQTVVAGETEIAHAILRYYRNTEPVVAKPSRARSAVQTAQEGSDEDIKITDMSGKTMVKFIPGMLEQIAKGPIPIPAKPDAGASDLLDEMLGGSPAASDELSEEDHRRIAAVRDNQEKSGKVLRALVELLTEKGYLTPADKARFRL